MGYTPDSVKGGAVEIWARGKKMEYCGGSISVPAASEEEFKRARTGELELFK